jgi:HEAT repeat protein
MARKADLAAQLAELKDSTQDPSSAESIKNLQTALADRSNHLVALAAGIAGDNEITLLEPDLVTAFDRFMTNPIKRDPGCAAKIAIIETLLRLDAGQEDLYLRAIRHVQMEPVYGGREDTGSGLRAASALALVQVNSLDVMVELADLLADGESDARIGAARAIGFAGKEASHPLLRYKILVGDPDARVLYECFVALLRIDPQSSLSFVGDNIQSDDPAVAEVAALALGESRLAQAFPILQAHWTEVEEFSVGRAILLALALLRYEPATDFLIALVAEAPFHQAADSLGALEMYRHDKELWRRVEETVAGRGDARLSRIAAGV